MTASTGKGLNTASNSCASRVVDPVGKYQVSEGAEAHGLLAIGVVAARSATTSATSASTITAKTGSRRAIIGSFARFARSSCGPFLGAPLPQPPDRNDPQTDLHSEQSVPRDRGVEMQRRR